MEFALQADPVPSNVNCYLYPIRLPTLPRRRKLTQGRRSLAGQQNPGRDGADNDRGDGLEVLQASEFGLELAGFGFSG